MTDDRARPEGPFGDRGGRGPEHYVNPAPFDPAFNRGADAGAGALLSWRSQWRLMWWKFKRHRLASGLGGLHPAVCSTSRS